VQSLQRHRPIDGVLVDVPRRLAFPDDQQRPPRLPTHIGIAPGARYDARRGFLVSEGTQR